MKRILTIFLCFILVLTCYNFEICDNFTKRTIYALQDTPSVRGEYAMVFDSVNNKTILHGGFKMEELLSLDDTWLFDFSENLWSNVTLSTNGSTPTPTTTTFINFIMLGIFIILLGVIRFARFNHSRKRK